MGKQDLATDLIKSAKPAINGYIVSKPYSIILFLCATERQTTSNYYTYTSVSYTFAIGDMLIH